LGKFKAIATGARLASEKLWEGGGYEAIRLTACGVFNNGGKGAMFVCHNEMPAGAQKVRCAVAAKRPGN
jgi:hypothetical protein